MGPLAVRAGATAAGGRTTRRRANWVAALEFLAGARRTLVATQTVAEADEVGKMIGQAVRGDEIYLSAARIGIFNSC